MFISLGEIAVIVIISLLILKPDEIVSAMYKIGSIVKHFSDKYHTIISKVENWWNSK